MTSRPDSRPAPRSASRALPDAGRRALLKGAALAGVAAAAAAAGAAEARETPEEQTKSRYRLSPHVERFYALNRL